MSKIIELQESTADERFSNGDYQVSLKYSKDLVLKDGDQLIVKNVFVDTLSQSNQKINIPKNISATLDIAYYYTYTRQDALEAIGTGGQLPTIDGQNYILSFDPAESSSNQLVLLSEVKVVGYRTNPAQGQLQVNYTDENNNPKSISYNIPTASEQDPSSDVKTYVVGKEGSFTFKVQDPDWRVIPTFEELDAHIQPYYEKINFEITSGSYTPQQLVIEMNRQVQLASTGGESNPEYKNKSFVRVQDLIPTNTAYLVREDGDEVVKVSDKTLLIGASFFELSFEEDTNQFSFNYIHTPYYSDPVGGSPAQEAVGYLVINPNPLDVVSVNKNSGIFFSGYSSVFDDGTTAFFWEETLGFKANNFTIQLKQKPKTTINGQVITPFETEERMEDGKNITGGFMPLNSQQNLNSADWWKGIDFTTITSPFLSTATDTINILGTQETTSNSQFSFGYFLISIDAKFRSSFFSKEVKENIMAIVSRYYEVNSFTSGTSDDSLVYTHKGQPVALDSFRVKVLNPNKQLAPNLGENTAIYMELVSSS